MATRRRLGMSTVAILRAMADGRSYGFDIMDATGLPGGTVYPALAKLERDGLVDSRWEDAETARAEKRPPRRYYVVTENGMQRLRESLAWLAGDLSESHTSR